MRLNKQSDNWLLEEAANLVRTHRRIAGPGSACVCVRLRWPPIACVRVCIVKSRCCRCVTDSPATQVSVALAVWHYGADNHWLQYCAIARKFALPPAAADDGAC